MQTILTYLSTLFILLPKALLLNMLIEDRTMVKLFHSACSSGPHIGERCPVVTLVYLSTGYRERLFNFSRSTNYMDSFTCSEDERSILLWDKRRGVWFWDGGLLPSHKTVVCGDWLGNYWSGMGFLLWFLLNSAPHLLYSVIDFSLSAGVQELSSTFTSFPQIILSPVFSMFGFRKVKDRFILSAWVSWTSCFLSWLGCGVSFIYISDTTHVFLWTHRNNSEIIAMAPMALFYSTFLTGLVLHLPYLKISREDNCQGQMGGGTAMICRKRLSRIFSNWSPLFQCVFIISFILICISTVFIIIVSQEVWFAKPH